MNLDQIKKDLEEFKKWRKEVNDVLRFLKDVLPEPVEELNIVKHLEELIALVEMNEEGIKL